MPKYNLDALGSQDFENLCQSLVQQIIGHGAKIYGMGKDGAREATFQGKAPYPSEEEQWEGNWIFQAKFHDIQLLGHSKVRGKIVNDLNRELQVITETYEHPCDNYILATNVSLSPVFRTGTKDQIDKKIIPKYISQISNIHVWGAEEICRFLDAYPGIRQSYVQILPGDVIARLLTLVEEQETESDELIKLYCLGSFTREKYALLDDAGDIEDERIELQQVFIDLDVDPIFLSPETSVHERSARQQAPRQKREQRRISALSCLLDDEIDRIVLVGGPGSGKSTLGQFVAQIYRSRLIGKLHDLTQDGSLSELFENCIPRIPFRVLLREYAQWLVSSKNSGSLFHFSLPGFTNFSNSRERCGSQKNTADYQNQCLAFNP